MSRFIAIAAGIVVLLIAAVVAAPLLIPTSVYKQRVVELVKAQTGRDLVIGGDVGLSFFPRLAVKVEDVSLSNAPWAKDREMASMREMRAALKIMPLFRGEVQIDSFALVDPVIHLEVKADGTPNWQFEQAAAQPAAAQTAAKQNGGGGALREIRLGEVSISNGSATYRNAKTGASLAFEKIDVDLSMPSLDEPFKADGSLVWNSEPLKLSIEADRPRALTEGGETPADFALSSSKINATYKGTLRPLDGLRFAGDVKLDIGSVRALAAWLGNPLPAGNGFGPLAIEGKASGGNGTYSFSNARIGLDGMDATGDVTVVTGGARPFVKGKLALDRLDANIYMPGNKDGEGPKPVGQSGAAANGGWSNEPIDLSGLRAADADFALSAHELYVKNIKIGESALGLRLASGVLTANLNKLALYDGSGSGTLVLDGSSRVPQAKAAFSISGVSAEPFLSDAADFKRLEGKAAMKFDLSTAGASQREMVSALGGAGEIRFTNGAIKGINVAQLARTVLQGAVTGWQSGGSQDTDFSELGGTFTVTRGILANNDLKLLSPLVRVGGAGTVDLPNRSLNYRVTPKLVASLEGQGGTSDAKGLEVPLIIEGPWDQPRFRPDLQSMLKNPQQTIDQIKSLKGGGGKELLKGLLGGSQSGSAPAEGTGAADQQSQPQQEQPQEEKPADKLKKLFGG